MKRPSEHAGHGAHTRPSVHARAVRRPVPAAAVLAVVVVLAIAGFAAARYVMQQQQDGLATATDFYFTSDYLKESSENATYYIDPGTNDFTIELRNFADELRFTAQGIDYKLTVEGAEVDGPASGVIAGGTQNHATISVKPTAQDAFTVTATSTSPYAQTLTAQFIRAKGNRYTVEDASGNTAAVLTMTCADSGGPITLKLPDGVVPDATDGRLKSEGGMYSFTPGDVGVYSLMLLKTNKNADLSGSGEFADQIAVGTPSAT